MDIAPGGRKMKSRSEVRKQKAHILKHVQKKNGKWTTWQTVDESVVDGSEITHASMEAALSWFNTMTGAHLKPGRRLD